MFQKQRLLAGELNQMSLNKVCGVTRTQLQRAAVQLGHEVAMGPAQQGLKPPAQHHWIKWFEDVVISKLSNPATLIALPSRAVSINTNG